MAQSQLDQATIEALLAAARDASTRAYAPYSDFPVGAALLLRDGRIVTGCNVENISYPLSVCAERNAVGKAVELGEQVFHAVAVHAPKLPGCTPCGGCRQVLAEFHPKDRNLLVILDTAAGPEIHTLDSLLPRSFQGWE